MLKRIKEALYRFAKTVGHKFVVPAAAKRLWKRIRDEKDPNTLVFISHFAMGDYLYCMALIKEIKLAHPEKKIVVVAPERFRDLVESFGSYDRVVFISSGGGGNFPLLFQIKCLTANVGLSAKMFEDGIVPVPYAIMAQTPNFFDDHVNYISAIRRVFNLSDDAPIQYHALKRAPVRSIPDFEAACNRTVVLNPYSSTLTLSETGEMFFEEACRLLKNRGYTVYTNTIKDQKPVSGSLELRCSLEEMLSIAEKVPLVVSLRSGLLDLLAPTGVNMFVTYNKLWFYCWFDMDGWNCPGKIKQIYYEEQPGDAEMLMERFTEFLDELGM